MYATMITRYNSRVSIILYVFSVKICLHDGSLLPPPSPLPHPPPAPAQNYSFIKCCTNCTATNAQQPVPTTIMHNG